MKLHLLVVCACLVQICLSAPTGSAEESPGLTDVDIQAIRDHLNHVEGLDSKCRDDFIDTINKFRKDSTDEEVAQGTMELIALAVQTENNNVSKMDLKQLMGNSSDSSDSSETEADINISKEGFTDYELKQLENDLSNQLTPDQLQHAMRIFRGFREGTSRTDKEAAFQNLFTSAIQSLTNGFTIKAD